MREFVVLHGLSDEQLMRRYQKRLDARAFEALVDRFLERALAAAERVLGERARAEDAVQETFLRIVRSRRDYDPDRPFAPWFFTILRNVCLDARRRRAREAAGLEAMRPRLASEARAEVAAVDALDLLASLGERERSVLELKIVHGMSFPEIGAALGISEEAAKKRAQRGLRRIRRELEAGERVDDAAACVRTSG